MVFKVDPAQKRQLDRAEGLGFGYAEKKVTALGTDGQEYRAVTYVAEKSAIQQELRPYTWYKRFVVEGARQNNLPADYIAKVEAMPATEDPDRKRDAENRAVQCG